MNALPLYLALASATGLTALFSLVSCRPISKIKYRYWGAAFAIFCVSAVFLVLPFAFPVLKVGHHNWSGKTCSIVAVYAILLSRPGTDPARAFMTFAQRKGRVRRSMLIVLALVLFSALVSLMEGGAGQSTASAELLWFEATLPGIDEEAVFRAAFLGYLLAASATRPNALRSMTGPVLTQALLFGLAHALHVDAALHMHFDIETFAVTGTVAVGLAILTLDSGSILLPVIAHNVMNCVSVFV